VARSKDEIAYAEIAYGLIRYQMSARLKAAIEQGLVAAALIEGDGTAVAFAGAITADEVRPLAAFVIYRSARDDVGARLLAGEIISLALDSRDVALGIAARKLIVVAVLATSSAAQLALVESLRDDIARLLSDRSREGSAPPPPNAAGGSGSGPADLQLVEFGITVPRNRGKA